MFTVYILYSKNLDIYYKGFTENLNKRLENHLTGKSRYTSKANDWVLVFTKSFQTKKEAILIRKKHKNLTKQLHFSKNSISYIFKF